MVHPGRFAREAQIHNGFRPRATAEKAIRKRIATQHIKVFIEINRNHVARDIHVLTFEIFDALAKGGFPVIGIEFFDINVFEFNILQTAPRQFFPARRRDCCSHGDSFTILTGVAQGGGQLHSFIARMTEGTEIDNTQGG